MFMPIEARRIADAVPAATLKATPAELRERRATSWRTPLDLTVFEQH